jgi:hypothetical protein
MLHIAAGPVCRFRKAENVNDMRKRGINRAIAIGEGVMLFRVKQIGLENEVTERLLLLKLVL